MTLTLIPPPPETVVMRRKADFENGPSQWHFKKREQKGLCGYFVTGLENVEYSTLGEIKKICPSCWPFEVTK